MPELPAPLQQRATKLPHITDPTLGGVHQDGMATDIKYNDLAVRYNSLLDIYTCVKTGLESKDAKAMEKCLK
jgi:hypothetical protein